MACVAAAACQDFPPYVWLVDDPQARRQILPDYFHLVLWHGNRYGEVHTTTDSAGVAVWLPATRDSLPALMENRARLVEATGAWSKRFLLRQTLLDNINPIPGCAQLVLLAVDPACRHQGVGTALLDYQHQRLDQAGVPAFIRAETHEHDWYRRHGYTDTQVVCGPGADAPPLRPMYRRPHLHTQPRVPASLAITTA